MVTKPEYKTKWGIELSGNTSIVDRSSILGVYRHFRFWEELDDYNDTYTGATILNSPHVNVLGENEAHRAAKRMEVLLILFNGIEATFGRSTRKNNTGFLYQFLDNNMINSYSNLKPIEQDDHLKHYSNDDDFNIFMEELNNPFDSNVVEYLRNQYPDTMETEEGFMMEMATKDEISRNILIWRSLCEGDNIHFITNAYKIYDAVDYFLNKDGKEKYEEHKQNPLMSELIKQRNIMKKNNHFMNTYKYAGLLSRHGQSNEEAPPNADPKKSFEKLKSNLNALVLAWFDYQLKQYRHDLTSLDSDDAKHFLKNVNNALKSILNPDKKE